MTVRTHACVRCCAARSPIREVPSLMCCFFLVLSSLGPRFAILAMWIFGDRVDAASSSALWPLLGILVAPWTTLIYLLVWSPVGGLSGGEWILVAFGVAADIGTYVAKPVKSRYATTA